MKSVEIQLAISETEFLKLYQSGGRANVFATARDGRRVQFPASSLRRWLRHDGINGLFVIYFDDSNRLSRIERIS